MWVCLGGGGGLDVFSVFVWDEGWSVVGVGGGGGLRGNCPSGDYQ